MAKDMWRLILLILCVPLFGVIDLGVDTFVKEGHFKGLKNKRIGLVSNQTGVNQHLTPTLEVLKSQGVNVAVLFSPEHGWAGNAYAGEATEDGQS